MKPNINRSWHSIIRWVSPLHSTQPTQLTKLTSLLKRQAETSKTSREFKMIDTIKNILGHFGLLLLFGSGMPRTLSLVATAIATIYMIVGKFQRVYKTSRTVKSPGGNNHGVKSFKLTSLVNDKDLTPPKPRKKMLTFPIN